MRKPIREKLHQMGVSQSKASIECQVVYPTFSKIANGLLIPGPAIRERIAAYLSATEQELWPALFETEAETAVAKEAK